MKVTHYDTIIVRFNCGCIDEYRKKKGTPPSRFLYKDYYTCDKYDCEHNSNAIHRILNENLIEQKKREG